MIDGTLTLRVNLALVGWIYSQSDTVGTGVKIKGTGDSKLHDSPAWHDILYTVKCSDHWAMVRLRVGQVTLSSTDVRYTVEPWYDEPYMTKTMVYNEQYSSAHQ